MKKIKKKKKKKIIVKKIKISIPRGEKVT